MNAIELLKQDHQKVLHLIDEMEDTSEKAVKTREKLLAQFSALIKKHEKMEESVLYPQAKAKDDTHDLIMEAYEEHHLVDKILAEIAKLPADSDKWKAKLKVMRESLEHHITEEEQELFPKIKQDFDAETLEEFGDKMAQIQNEK